MKIDREPARISQIREIDGVTCRVTSRDGIPIEEALQRVNLHVDGTGPLKTVRATSRAVCEVTTMIEPRITCQRPMLDVLAGVCLQPGEVVAITIDLSSGRSPISISTCQETSQLVI